MDNPVGQLICESEVGDVYYCENTFKTGGISCGIVMVVEKCSDGTKLKWLGIPDASVDFYAIHCAWAWERMEKLTKLESILYGNH